LTLAGRAFVDSVAGFTYHNVARRSPGARLCKAAGRVLTAYLDPWRQLTGS
jgi:hypothetical protein